MPGSNTAWAPNFNVGQRLIAFVDRDAADEWWRTVSAPPSAFVGHVKRVSPQLYAQTHGTDVWNFFNNGQPSTNHFSERMFSPCILYDYSANPTTVIPPDITVTDHISGQWYFIRCKADPFSHWYLRTSGACAVCRDANCSLIHVSSDSRTRFCIRVRNDAQVPEDFVMIGKDEITITAPKGHILHISDAGDLKATRGYQSETDLLFSDLKERFVARSEKQANGELWEYVESVERGVGEPWELVK